MREDFVLVFGIVFDVYSILGQIVDILTNLALEIQFQVRSQDSQFWKTFLTIQTIDFNFFHILFSLQ